LQAGYLIIRPIGLLRALQPLINGTAINGTAAANSAIVSGTTHPMYDSPPVIAITIAIAALLQEPDP
jgi:hypothetical protein